MTQQPHGMGVLTPHQNYNVIVNGAVSAAASLSAWRRDRATLKLDRPSGLEWQADARYDAPEINDNYFMWLYSCSRATPAKKSEYLKFCAAVKQRPGHLAFLGKEPNQPDGSNDSVWFFGPTALDFRGRQCPNTPVALPGVVLNPSGWTWLGGYYILVEQGKALRLDPARGDCWQIDIFPQSGQHAVDLVGQFNVWKAQAGMPCPTILGEVAYGTDGYATMQSDLKNREIREAVMGMIDSGQLQAACWATSRWHSYPGPASDLLEENGQLTALGKAF